MASPAKKQTDSARSASKRPRPRLHVKSRKDPGAATAKADWNAYEQDRQSLLVSNKGWFVAYNEGKRIALAPTRDDAIKAVDALKPAGLVMIHQVCAKDEEPRVTFSSPRV